MGDFIPYPTPLSLTFINIRHKSRYIFISLRVKGDSSGPIIVKYLPSISFTAVFDKFVKITLVYALSYSIFETFAVSLYFYTLMVDIDVGSHLNFEQRAFVS